MATRSQVAHVAADPTFFGFSEQPRSRFGTAVSQQGGDSTGQAISTIARPIGQWLVSNTGQGLPLISNGDRAIATGNAFCITRAVHQSFQGALRSRSISAPETHEKATAGRWAHGG